MIGSEKDAALIAVAELEAALRGTGLPVVCLIGLPKTAEFVRFSGGMSSKENRAIFTVEYLRLMEHQADKAEKKGGG